MGILREGECESLSPGRSRTRGSMLSASDKQLADNIRVDQRGVHRMLRGILSAIAFCFLGLLAAAGLRATSEASAAQAISEPVRVTTLAHYVNWYNGTNFRNTTTLPANGLGAYDSTDPHVIAFHKSTFLRAGQTPLISWWGRDDSRGDEFLDIFFTIVPLDHKKRDVQVALLYEARGLLLEENAEKIDFNRQETRARFISDIVHLNSKYFSNPEDRDRFFTIDGRPVIFIWYSHAFVGPFDEAVSDARTYADFYLIGSNFTLQGNLLDEWKEFIPAFDAISAYGAYDQRFLSQYGGPNEKYLSQYFNGAALWSRWLAENAPDTDLILPMSFAFDNSKSEQRTTAFYMNTFEANLFAQMARLAIECSLSGSPLFDKVIPTIVFASFNEHFEGTPLERSTHYADKVRPYGVYGDIYRDIFLRPIDTHTSVDSARCEGLLY